MSETPEDFERLMERVRAGCPDAAREVFDRYSPHIRRVVRRLLHRRLRPSYDSIDFLQAVWASFFFTAPDRFTFKNDEALIAFLAQVAANKVVSAFRTNLQTDRHNLNRVRSLTDMSERVDFMPPADRQPSPSQLAIANERWEQMLANLPPQLRQVVLLLREGLSHQDIAERTGLHLKALQRLLRRFYVEQRPQS